MISAQPQPWTLRDPCKQCGSTDGVVAKSGPQNVARCAKCNTFAYCVPKQETGEERRTVRSRADIPPSTRARILERDGFKCAACGRGPQQGVLLHVGHMLSVEDAAKLKADGVPVRDDDLDSDYNYVTVCEEDNLGAAGRSYWLRTAYFILRANVERDRGSK